ncbi:MAG TPA: prepilin-type N-terminal cleavage/methylation domain-containing protein [Pirellulales bacterium]
MTGRLIHRRSRRAGFTLVEMLVVLAILAITTTIAVQSLVPVASEARYEATVQTLAAIRNSIVCTSTAADGTVTLSGLFPDTGILPFTSDTSLRYAVDNFNNPLAAAQPWAINFESPTAQPLAFAGATIDTQMFAGWNGPYVRPGQGQSDALDGWGRPFVFPTSLATDGSYTVGSAGADGQPNTSDDVFTVIYPTDYAATSLTVSLNEQVTGSSPYARTATLQQINGSIELSFWLVAFDMAAGTTSMAEGTGAPAPIAAIGPLSTSQIAGTSTAVPLTLPSSQYAQLPILYVGPIALRAYTSSNATTLSTGTSGNTVVRSSQPVVVTLTPRSAITKTLLFP